MGTLALEDAVRVGVFFTFGENFPKEMSLFVVLPGSLSSWALVCGWAQRKDW